MSFPCETLAHGYWHRGERGDTSFVRPGYQRVVWARECSSLSLPICTVEVPAGPHPGVMTKTQSTQHVDTANRSQMARVILTSRSLLADTPPAFRHLAGSGETAMVLNKLQPYPRPQHLTIPVLGPREAISSIARDE